MAAGAPSTAGPASSAPPQYINSDLDPDSASGFDSQEAKDLLSRYGIQTVRSVDSQIFKEASDALKEAKESISAAQYGFGELAKLGLFWLTIITDLLGQVYSSAQADGTYITGSVEEALFVLFGALQTGFSNARFLKPVTKQVWPLAKKSRSHQQWTSWKRLQAARSAERTYRPFRLSLQPCVSPKVRPLTTSIPLATLIGKGHRGPIWAVRHVTGRQP